MTTVRVERLPHAEGLPLPAYETRGSAGMDLRAALAEDAPLTLEPGAREPFPSTGVNPPSGQAWAASRRLA